MSTTRQHLALALTLMIPWLAAACAPSIQPTPQPTAPPTVAPTAQPTPTLSPGPTTTPQPSATSAAQSDLDNVLAQIEVTHPEPWHGIPRDEWVAALDDLKARLPGLTPEEAYAGLCRLVASLSHEGRDGHQFVILPDDQEQPALPFRTYEFAEGVFVTAAMLGYEELVGRRIEAIDGMQIDDVLAALEPLVPRDGPATVPGFRTIFLLRTSVLRGLGLVGDGAISILVSGDGQPEEVVEVIPADWADWRAWAGDYGIALPARDDTLYLSDPDTTLWWRTLPESHTLYVRYQRVQLVDSADATAIAAAAADPEVTRVVFDLRQNPGGDNHNIATLLAVLRDVAASQPGRLYVLTDRLTFSAAANFATQIEQTTDAVFAGEQMGGGLNFWDDVRWVDLPHYPLSPRVGVSTRYWQFSAPDDPRLTIEPDIALPLNASDYFAGRDPVMEASTAQ